MGHVAPAVPRDEQDATHRAHRTRPFPSTPGVEPLGIGLVATASRIAVLGAMPSELRRLVKPLGLRKAHLGAIEVRTGRLGGAEVVALKTGIGPVEAQRTTEQPAQGRPVRPRGDDRHRRWHRWEPGDRRPGRRRDGDRRPFGGQLPGRAAAWPRTGGDVAHRGLPDPRSGAARCDARPGDRRPRHGDRRGGGSVRGRRHRVVVDPVDQRPADRQVGGRRTCSTSPDPTAGRTFPRS